MASPNANRIPSLDGVRAISILLVLASHVAHTTGFYQTKWIQTLLSRGPIGVEVFFVVSGFLITSLLLNEKRRDGRIWIAGFYYRRVRRIVPVYLVYLLVVLGLSIQKIAHLQTRDWVAALTYTMNWIHNPAWEVGHSWSLSIEEHFYLLWPLIVSHSFLWAKRVAWGTLGLCFTLRWLTLLFFPYYSSMAELWTFTRMDAIATGCVLAFLVDDPKQKQLLLSFIKNKMLLLLTVTTLVLSISMSLMSAKISVGICYTLNQICIAILIWATIQCHTSLIGKVLNFGPVAWVGKISYSLYLWQQLFLYPSSPYWIRSYPQNIFFSFFAASLSYYLIEKTFLRLPVGQAPTKQSAETNRLAA